MARISQQVLDMSPHTLPGCFKSDSLDSVTNSPQSAEIVLPGFHGAAEIKVAGLQQSLG